MTAEELDQQIQADPDFQKLSPDKQVEFAMHAYEAAGLGKRTQAGADETLAPRQVSPAENPVTPLRTLAGQAGRLGLNTAGAVAGAKQGALKGAQYGSRLGPYGTLAGGVIGGIGGATVGGFTGDVAGQGYEDLANLRKPTLDLREAAKTGLYSGAGEGVVRTGIGLYNTALSRPIGNALTGRNGVTQEGLDAAQHGEDIGVTLRPAEVSGMPTAAAMEQNVRRSLFAKGKFYSLDVANEKALSQRMTDLTNTYFPAGRGMGPLEIGSRLQTIVKGGTIPEWQATTRELYKNLDEASSFTTVDTTKPLQTARELLTTLNPKAQPKAYAMMERIVEDLSQPGPVTGMTIKRGDVVTRPDIKSDLRGQSTELRDSMSKTGENVSDRGFVIPGETKLQGAVPGGMTGQPQLRITTKSEAPRQPTQLSFLKAHEIRSNLLDISRGKDEVLPARYEALAKKFAGEVDGAMSSAAQAVSPKVYQMWREANQFVKDGHELFDAATTKALLEKSPEDVVNIGFRKGEETETKRIMQLLGTGDAFNAAEAKMLYRRTAMEKALADASAGGYLDPHKLYSQFYGPRGVGKAVMEATFEPGYLNELNKTLAVAKRMNMTNLSAGNPSGTGGAVMNWFETGMLIRIPSNFLQNVIKTVSGQNKFSETLIETAKDIQQAGIYVMTQRDLAELMNSKEGLRVLREGLELPAKSVDKARVVTQLFTHMLGMAGRPQPKREPATPSPTPSRTQVVPQEQLQ